MQINALLQKYTKTKPLENWLDREPERYNVYNIGSVVSGHTTRYFGTINVNTQKKKHPTDHTTQQ